VKKLEKKLKHKQRRAVLGSSSEEEASLDYEDSPKQGRMIEEIEKDDNVNLVKSSEQEKAHKRIEHRINLNEAITKEMHDGLGRATTTTSSLVVEQGSGNISKTQTKATPSGKSSLKLAQKVVPGATLPWSIVLFRLSLKGYLTCPMNHHSEKVTHLKVGRAAFNFWN
nr:hypothetical protein [Tanacetum cinerariifolium]